MSQIHPPAPRCWIVTDGNAGMENQCLGLAAAIGVTPEIRRIRLRPLWEWLPPQITARLRPLAGLHPEGDRLDPPWPDLLIATGRRTVALSVAIKQLHPRTVTVQIQNPHYTYSAFDLVVTPEHDQAQGNNVISTTGALHGVTRARLDAAAAEFGGSLAHLPRPLVAVLIGGANKVYRMTPAIIAALCEGLRDLANATGCSFAVTPSRRTGAENIAALQKGLADVPHVIWDGQGGNPYFAFLGLADAIIVTSDSVNMVSEACASGKAVYVYDLPGGSRKFDAFHKAMRRRAAVRPFRPGEIRTLEAWTPAMIDDTAMVAKAVQRLLIIRSH